MEKYARFIGLDISTTAVTAGVRDTNGEEDLVAVPIRGSVSWKGQPAIEADTLAPMLAEALEQLQQKGWRFSQPGDLCASVRQHDMVLLGADGEVLIPFITWQCHAATQEVEELRKAGAEDTVGRIEPRFILSKLKWALNQEPGLAEKVRRVMTTGDYMARQLTGAERLSCSDAISNGLLDQKTKELATAAMALAKLSPAWFPAPIPTGEPVGTVDAAEAPGAWRAVAETLAGWTIKAGLGDNHAGGVGSGLADRETVVISLGSSGTVIRRCRPDAKLRGNAARFEYFDDSLLLEMLADCAVWYDRFVRTYNTGNLTYGELNDLALQSPAPQFIGQAHTDQGWKEVYPADWESLLLAVKVQSTQASIAVHMLRLVKDLLGEVTDADVQPITRFVITGGLSRSAFIQSVLETGLSALVPNCRVQVSSRQGPLANKGAVLGALFTAMVGTPGYPDLSSVVNQLCGLQDVKKSTGGQAVQDFVGKNL
ncbi:MAG TPA: FGGY family carbohydrate kinase [Bryobacteraceae bacterium]|nr:FGGY family carbohydrate kinase [Bryobacteraceae bacterium]